MATLKSSSGTGLPSDTTPFLVAYSISIASGLWVYGTLKSRQLLPTTDLGQWIMYSRPYLGNLIPSYRVGHGISPLLPAILAITTVVFHDSVKSAIITSGLLYFALSLTAFFTAKELFNSDVAGIIATILTSFGQYFFSYLTAFGGLPQLGAIISMNVAIYGLARISRNWASKNGWCLLTASFYLVPFFHIPTAPIFYISIFISLFFLGRIRKDILLSTLLRSCKYLSMPLFAWLTYVIIFLKQEFNYTNNSAGYQLLGINTLISYFAWSPWIYLLVTALLISMIFIAVYTFLKIPPYNATSPRLILIWTLTPISFMIFCYFIKIGTDYQRFIYYFIEPPLFTLSYILTLITKYILQKSPNRSYMNRYKKIFTIIIMIVILAVITNTIRFSTQFYLDSVDYFSPKYSISLLNLISWIKTVPGNGTVLAPSLAEANWIEGLSGRATLFSNKFRWLYRPGLADRALAADLIGSGTEIAVDNGAVYVGFEHASESSALSPSIAVYHKGEYFDEFMLQDRLITIEASIDGKDRKINLDRDFIHYSQPNILYNKDDIKLSSRHVLSIPGSSLILYETTTVKRESADVFIDFALTTSISVKVKSIIVQFMDKDEAFWNKTVNGTNIESIKIQSNNADIRRSALNKDYISENIAFSPIPTYLRKTTTAIYSNEPYLEAIYYIKESSKMNIRIGISSQDQGRWHDDVRVSKFLDLLKTYEVAYLITNRSDNHAQSIYDAYGFPKVFSNLNYIVYKVPSK